MSGDRILAGVLLLLGAVGGAFLITMAIVTPVDEEQAGRISAEKVARDLDERGAEVLGTTELPAPSLDIKLPMDRTAAPPVGPSTLVLFDPPAGADEDGSLAELDAVAVANLAGHFGPVTTRAVTDYRPGEGQGYGGVIYAGTRGANPLPEAFLDDVRAETFDVLWLGDGIDLLAADERFVERYGWLPDVTAAWSPVAVWYDDVALPRDGRSQPPVGIDVVDDSLVTVLASSTDQVTTATPYAVRSANLTYVAETPFEYLAEGNHSLIVADLLFDLLDPDRPERRRALVRLEDIGPNADVDSLLAAADLLHDRRIPFSFGVYPLWRDPLGQTEVGAAVSLADRPDLVEALRYLEDRGGTMVMHGVTHQLGDGANPRSGLSGEDFEFVLVTEDESGRATEILPTPEDSEAWVQERVLAGFEAFAQAGLEPPTMFEFPHYLGSRTSYEALSPVFDARYEQTAYYPGLLSGDDMAGTPRVQFFPYPVHDVYGEHVVPENLGSITLDPVGVAERRMPADIVDAAEHVGVVRDSVASFYVHPFIGTDLLAETLDGIEGLGFEFVSAETVMAGWR